jgi:hypothetical protein
MNAPETYVWFRLGSEMGLTWKPNNRLLWGYFRLSTVFRFTAQRAFISSDSRFLPAVVNPSFFPAAVLRPVLSLAFCFAQRAWAAADNLARVAADILPLPLWDVNRVEVPPRIDASCLFKASICRRTETASCKALRDISTPI